MNIGQKTLGQLIDELFSTDHRCWEAQDKLQNLALSDSERLNFAVMAQQQNAKRTELIRAIDELMGFTQYTNTTKTYNKE